jgi:hypothetical protein
MADVENKILSQYQSYFKVDTKTIQDATALLASFKARQSQPLVA